MNIIEFLFNFETIKTLSRRCVEVDFSIYIYVLCAHGRWPWRCL